MNISIDIERLILDGVTIEPGQGAQLKAAVESELARLLATGGVHPGLRSGGSVPSIRANSIRMSSESNPSQLGRQIALSVYGGIGK